MSEAKMDVTVRDVKGTLHAHRINDPDSKNPDVIAAERLGSNCGKVTIEELLRFHDRMNNLWVAPTDHSRDGGPANAMGDVTNWFDGLNRDDKDRIKKMFGTEGFPEGKDSELRKMAEEQAKRLLYYDDKRLGRNIENLKGLNLEEITNRRDDKDIPVFKGNKEAIINGVEASIMAGGKLDTEMVGQGRFELVNIAIHPNTLPEGDRDIARDPQKYTDLVIAGMEENPRANIMCHIGWGCPDLKIEELDWKRIGEMALKHKVAIEVNLYDFLLNCVYSGNKAAGEKAILDLEAYPKDNVRWRDDMADRLHKYAPIIFSPKIRDVLAPLVAQGLKFSINADEHVLPPDAGKFMPEMNYPHPEELPFRFVRMLKILEVEFNRGFSEMGATSDSIINTYDLKKLREFLHKP